MTEITSYCIQQLHLPSTTQKDSHNPGISDRLWSYPAFLPHTDALCGIPAHREDNLHGAGGSTADLILGRLWLSQHQSSINWNTGEVLSPAFISACHLSLNVLLSRSHSILLHSTTVESHLCRKNSRRSSLSAN